MYTGRAKPVCAGCGAGLILALAGMLCLFRTAGADSMFGSGHMGIPVSAGDTRSRAMGGASVAVGGENFSFTNPARLVNFWRSGFNGVMSQDYRNLSDPSASLRSSEFLAFRGVFPVFKKYVASWGIFQSRDMDWQLNDRIELPSLGGNLDRKFASDGGLYVSRLSVARQINPHLALGLGLDWFLGRVKQERYLNFGSADFRNTDEVFYSRFGGLRPTLGALLGYGDCNVGFMFSPPKRFKTEKQVSSLSGYQDKQTVLRDYPLSWRLGACYKLKQRLVLAADLGYEGWGGFEGALDPDVASRNQWQWCLGAELIPPAPGSEEVLPFYRKLPVRLGFSHTTYPFELDGARVGEYFFCFGTGSYFGAGDGLADIAFEWGVRKAETAFYPKEKIFRIVFSLSAFERWIPQPRRPK